MLHENDPTFWSVDARDMELSRKLLHDRQVEDGKKRVIERAVRRLEVADMALVDACRERTAAELQLRALTKDLPPVQKLYYRQHLNASTGFGDFVTDQQTQVEYIEIQEID